MVAGGCHQGQITSRDGKLKRSASPSAKASISALIRLATIKRREIQIFLRFSWATFAGKIEAFEGHYEAARAGAVW